jgi:outer membrane protein assembly factor BamD (BamD/ComL family)
MSGMHTDRLGWFQAFALLAAVAASGCGMVFENRSPAADPFVANGEPQPQTAAVRRIEPVVYDERDDYSSSQSSGDDGLTAGDFAPGQLGGTIKKLTGNGPNQRAAKDLFEEGQALFEGAQIADPSQRKEKFAAAAEKYLAAARRWPDSALEEAAMMMVGESRYFADQYPKAEAAYEELIKKWPNSTYMDKVAARRFTLARWWLAKHKKNPRSLVQPNFTDASLPHFDTFGSAIRIYDRIRLDDPTGKLADDATMAAASAYFESEKYRLADHYLADLRENFPNSPHQFQAHLLGVMCKLKIYQGPDYNDRPLEEAEELIEQIYRQFPDHVAEEREHLEKAFAEVRVRKARRRHYYAKYYERRGEYGGARYYYSKIVEEFPNSSLAEMAQERIGEIAERPERPPQRVPWLVKLFPDPPRQEAWIRHGDENPITRFLYDPMSIARGNSGWNGTNSHLR